jgi:dTDP-glucose 4,6-dehydratase
LSVSDAIEGDRDFGHLLVTGGAGFIGSCYVRDVLGRRDGTRITVLDKLTYAGNEANLAPVRDDPEMAARYRFVRGDIADASVVEPLVASVDGVVNFAAESHVDRSILDPEAFLATGVVGVHVLLDACLASPSRPRFLQVSTDEVYGSVAEGHATEAAPLAPRSPYAAAKAAGELLVRSYVITHGVDAVVTRGSNTYGPYHHPEKLIPLFVTNAIDDKPLPLYGDGLQRREWLYVGDHAAGIDHVLRRGATGETYNIAGPTERTNRDVVELLLGLLGKPWSLVMEVEDRKGHDRRYAMDGSKLAALGWRPRTSFEAGLAETVAWYRANESWWRASRSGDWDSWYERQYADRLATGQAAPANREAGTAAVHGAGPAGALSPDVAARD